MTGRDVTVVMGAPLLAAASALLLSSPGSLLTFTTQRLFFLLLFELAVGTLSVVYLWHRGWRLNQITTLFDRRDPVRALGVWLVAYLAYVAGWLLLVDLNPGLAARISSQTPTGHPALLAIGLTVVVNPIYEELLWLGFAANGPGQRRLPAAVFWSLLPRCLVHLYQGWLALFAIAPIGLWYLRYYWRSGRLWPVILAHALQDAIALLFLSARGAA